MNKVKIFVNNVPHIYETKENTVIIRGGYK